uniref:Uncharacterized protein n=1 Tax=Tanacetum cinerariifolium TaxID=118510 RepID=A0A699UNJ4_TANCI|nr:hypothetical protein [Tanacetum cinerariifolium]
MENGEEKTFETFTWEKLDYNNFAVGDAVVEVVEFVEALLNKIEQLLVGVKMHRLHLHFHGQKKLSGKQ